MSSLQKELFKKSKLPPLESVQEDEGMDSGANDDRNTKKLLSNRAKYSPYSWEDYFEECKDVTITNSSDIFRIYRNKSKSEKGPIFIMHHGAGSSGLTFGLTARYIKELTRGECGVMAIDCRGHGASRVQNDDGDFSLETLTDDLIRIIQQTVDIHQEIILVGHSMGGAVVVNAACKKTLRNITGVTVLDVVEGSAIDALSSMTKILNSRPKTFTSVEQAILWSLQSKTVHTTESARLSIPALIERTEEGNYKWITDLVRTQPFWEKWFTGLSEKFLNTGAAKLLILAGTDRLDKPLIIGQMQGKFQLNIFPESGHFVQEDTPMKTAACLVEFWRRNRKLVLPPKVKV